MNVRVVAYRKDLPSDDDDQIIQFELDLAEAPNIVVNYNWIDIREPDKRTGSFSQTIKIPFTNRNNTFFENWFNVNLDGLVFDTNTKFNATVFVDTVEQMRGFIQLKAIYLNARQYEVVVFGNSSNFFTDIKDKKLRQAFEKVSDSGVITADEQLDHLLTAENVVNSWNAGLTTIANNPTTGSGTSNDVMYPIIDYALTLKPYSEGIFEDITTDEFNDINWDLTTEFNFILPRNLKPAIRIQRLLQIIAQKAGYTITSTFLGINQDGTLEDTSWFSRLFMTLANQYTSTKTYYSGLGFQVSMAAPITNAQIYGDQNEPAGALYEDNYVWAMSCARELGFTNESDPNFDPMDTFSVDSTVITTPDGDEHTIQLNTISFPNIAIANQLGVPENYLNDIVAIYAEFSISFPAPGAMTYPQWWDSGSGTLRDFNFGTGGEGPGNMTITLEYTVNPGGIGDNVGWSEALELNNIPMSYYNATNYDQDWPAGLQNIPMSGNFFISGVTDGGGEVHFRLRFSPAVMGGGIELNSFDYFYVNINSGMIKTTNTGGNGYTNGSYGMQVVIAENMPDLDQSDFVKDLVNRFNLVVVNDNANTDNLIIEPYQDYIAGGTTQYWTDKLDVSKEQVIKSTNELQKKEFIFQDKEGSDHLNKQYKDNWDLVYGYKKESGGDFSEGDGKNFSIYAPFIAQGIMQQGEQPWQFSGQSNLPVAIAQIYEVGEDIDNLTDRTPTTDGIPRLFYYSGTPINIDGVSGVTSQTFHFRIVTPAGYSNVSTGGSQGQFPLCTQYNLDDLNTGITSSTKQLLWDFVSPRFYIPWYCSNPFGNSVTTRGYYYEQWSQYFNEIYNNEARIMECYLNLTPTDVTEFEAEAFKNPVYIKNTLWRIIKIDGYLVGGNKSTKATLLKVIEKLNWDCSAVPDTYNANGTITFINPASGAATTVTNECCEDMNSSWTFMQTDDSTGVGDCYHNLDIDVVNPGGSTGELDGNVAAEGNSIPLPMPSGANIHNQVQTRDRRIFCQSSNLIFNTITIGTTTNYLGYKGESGAFRLGRRTMAYLEVDIIGTIVKGSSNVGSIGYFKYFTLLKRIAGLPTHEGASGGTQVQKIEGTDFPTTPTISLTNINELNGNIEFAITSSSADYTISWVAKVQILAQKLVGLEGENVYNDFAIYQNRDNIIYENADYLEWN